jgi:hypothetical protein
MFQKKAEIYQMIQKYHLNERRNGNIDNPLNSNFKIVHTPKHAILTI